MTKTTKHNCRSNRLYRTYHDMLSRCYNPNHKSFYLYGGRNIGVCDEWQNSYDSFAEWSITHGYDSSLPGKLNSIDRIDPDGDYSPENCRWISMRKQAANRRCVAHIAFNGETHTLPEWAEITGIDYTTLYSRYHKQHWPIEMALATPPETESLKFTDSNGVSYSIRQIADMLDVPYPTIYARIKRAGWSIDEILAGRDRFTVYTDKDNNQYTLTQLASAAGISKELAWYRIDAGWTIDQILKTPPRKAKKYLASDGSLYTVQEIATLTHTNRTTVQSRLNGLGWSVDECLAGCRLGRPTEQENA